MKNSSEPPDHQPVPPPVNDIVPVEKKGPKKFVWTPERKEFCRLYVQTHNATESYVKSHNATYSTPGSPSYKVLEKRANRLLHWPAIRDQILSLEAPFWRKFPFSADQLMLEAATIAHSNIGDYFDFTGDEVKLKKAKDIPRWAQGAIQSIRTVTKTRRQVIGKDENGKPVYQETVTQTTNLKLFPKNEQIKLFVEKFGLASHENVLDAVLKDLPAELRLKVAQYLLQESKIGEANRIGVLPPKE